MASLYDIDQRILALVDEETGEIEDFEALNKLQIERDEKIENLALWVKNLKADEESYKAEKQSFEEKQRQARQRRESLERYISEALGGEKFKTSRVECSFKKSSRVEIDDIFSLPKEFLRYKDPEADKTAIKEAVKDGKEVAGARLVTALNLQIK
ncbi:MAG: siphovirus Gp157 family protein [Bacteroides sp.]|nr:siphovirus Gp157 family protein [Bacteroides sp.]